MKVVVSRNALDQVIDDLVNEDRSFHSKNVNELEKADPPILPSQQVAKQISRDKMPIDDPQFMPTNKTELGQAAMDITQEIDSRMIERFYKALKKLANQAKDKPPQKTSTTHSMEEARAFIDKFVKGVLTEARGDDQGADKDIVAAYLANLPRENPLYAGDTGQLLSSEEAKTPEMMKNNLRTKIINQIAGLTEMFIKAEQKNLLKISIESGEDPRMARKSASEFLPEKDDFAGFFAAMIDDPRNIKISYPKTQGPIRIKLASSGVELATEYAQDIIKLTENDILDVIFDAIFRSANSLAPGTTPASKFFADLRNKMTGASAPTSPVSTEEIPPEEQEVLAAGPDADVDPKSHLETGAYNLALDDVIDMMIKKPDEFVNLMHKIEPVTVNGQSYDPKTLSLTDFEALDDITQLAIIKKIALLPKEVFGPVKRELQIMARGLGNIFANDGEMEHDFKVDEKGSIQASPRATFSNELMQSVYDEAIVTPIRQGLNFQEFDVTLDEFLAAIGRDQLEKFRDFTKDIVKKSIVNNSSEFRDVLDIFYHILKMEKLAAKGDINEVRGEEKLLSRASLSPYRGAVEILNRIGMTLDKSMLDQNFRDMISLNHLARALVYAIVIKYIVETYDLSPESRENKKRKALQQIESLYELSPAHFVDSGSRATKDSPARSPGIGYLMGFKSPEEVSKLSWPAFYSRHKEKIDSFVEGKIDARSKDIEEIQTNARNLTGPVEPLVSDILAGIENSISKLVGKSVEKGIKKDIKKFTSIDPKLLDYIIAALQTYKGKVDEADAVEIEDTLTQLKASKPGATVDNITLSKKPGEFPPGETIFERVLGRLARETRKQEKR